LQGLRIGQAMIAANFDERRRGQAAIADQLFAFFKRDDIVGLGVEDDCAGFDGCGGTPSFPGGAKKDDPGIGTSDIHRYRAASR